MSRAGSQVMNKGRTFGRFWGSVMVEGDGAVKLAGVLLMRVMTWAILSSSSGQMSGQWVKPK